MPPCEICGEELPLKLSRGPNPANCWWNAEAHFRRLFPTRGALRLYYVEGWAVRIRDGSPEAFEHGWVELDGKPLDDTPHHHVIGDEGYFAGIKREGYDGRDSPPVHQCPTHNDPSRSYDPGEARDYAAAKARAKDFCTSVKERLESGPSAQPRRP